jgi:hypothetical protein
MTTPSEASGRIVQTWKDGQRILWTYVPDLPAQDARHAMPWLTVLRWEYNGSDFEGMPTADENQHMLMLDAVLGKMERPGFCVECYRRIGAGLIEFVFSSQIAKSSFGSSIIASQMIDHTQSQSRFTRTRSGPSFGT